MSKSHLGSVVLARKGQAIAANTTAEPLEAVEPRSQGRKRTWDEPGKDQPVKVNYEIPERLADKIAQLKSWKKIRTVKEFVATTLEAEADRLIAKAEKEGY